MLSDRWPGIQIGFCQLMVTYLWHHAATNTHL